MPTLCAVVTSDGHQGFHSPSLAVVHSVPQADNDQLTQCVSYLIQDSRNLVHDVSSSKLTLCQLLRHGER